MGITFKLHYPISRTMAFEKEYHPNLQLTLREKRECLKEAITIWMFANGTLVGETYGIPLGVGTEMPPGCPRDANAIYCYSNTILHRYQGEGYGTILKAAFIGHVAGKFHSIYGHARPGASQALNRKFGARFLTTHRDWYGTGEDYRLYILPIHGVGRRA